MHSIKSQNFATLLHLSPTIELYMMFYFICLYIAGADLEVRHNNTEESVLLYKRKHCIY